jgi:ABC-type sugar transport system ATPase subunit
VAEVVYEHVRKQFGNFDALRDLCLKVNDGEFVVLLGPSGSGKTTALRILAGLETLSEGHVWIGNRIVEDLAPRYRKIAMVFQDYALYPQMTVYQNLAFGLKVQKLPKTEIRRRVTDAGDVLELAELMNRKPRELSGGQRQRVALGRALVRDPEVFLMDEPLSNLDAKLRTQTRGEIKRLQKDRGKTTIYVTHDQVEAMTMGDRIALLREGNLEQVGDAQEVYSRPVNAFVAGFLGSPAMSFAPFEVRATGSGTELVNGTVRFVVPAWPPALGSQGRSAIRIGVRPEDVMPWSAGGDLVGPLKGRIQYVEALGRETFVGVEVGDGVSFTAQIPGGERVDPGDVLELGFKKGRMYLFDELDGSALGLT